MRERLEQQMTQNLTELSVTLSDRQMEQFYQYYQLLTEWNRVMNLTAITELEEVVTKHFVDSLTLVKAVDREKLRAEYLIWEPEQDFRGFL